MSNFKKSTKRYYGNIPFRETEVFPINFTHVEPVGNCTVLFKTSYETNIKTSISTLTAVVSYTYWPGVIYINDKSSDIIRRILDKNWLCYFPRTVILVHHNGTGFTGW